MTTNRQISDFAWCAWMLAWCPTGSALAASAAMPTFSKDVAPIVFQHCANCHRPGEIAPMSLLTYEQVRPWAKSIREKVASGLMPPWHADAPRGTFSNDRRLTDSEKDTLIRWVSAGAPEGDARDLPPAPKFTQGWEIGKPDVVLSIPPYEVPASGTIEYQNFSVPTNFTEDKWIQAIEVRPGVRSVVHHVLVFSREPGGTARPVAFVSVVPPRPTAARPPASASPAEPQQLGPPALIATMAPGTKAMTFEPSTAIRIRAGAVLSFQLHYTTNGQASVDQSSVGMIFAKQPPTQELRTSAFTNQVFSIPAGATDQAVDSAIQFEQDSHIFALFPHTHLRGKSWRYVLVYPDGHSEVVLSVPKYDFNWQTFYEFATPLAVPKGSRLEATAHYDNSLNNPSNPDPKVEVRWGEQTWNEMQ
jgi:mono/diheme cytochrome c family protein